MLCFPQGNTASLLPPGAHEIAVDASVEGPHCGLVPLGGPCASVTTRGLRWNLDAQPLAFGGLVSTSNLLVGDAVEVETSDPLVFTVGSGVS